MTAGQLLVELSHTTGDRATGKWILSEVLGCRPGALQRTRLDEGLADDEVAQARSLAERCAAGEPLQYVLGSWGFRTLDLMTDRRALIPRPETEQVAGFALERLAERFWPPSKPVAVDLGTGSGAIALALAVEGPAGAEIWATDASPRALELAEQNLKIVCAQHQLAGSVHLAPGSWFEALPDRLRGAVDLIVANPPYVSAAEFVTLEPVVRDHEPPDALLAGPQGIEAIAVVVAGAPGWLAPGGSLVVEMGATQGSVVHDLAVTAGLVDIEIRRDLAGRDRALVARRPEP